MKIMLKTGVFCVSQAICSAGVYLSTGEKQSEHRQPAFVHGCCSEPCGKPYADIARCQKIQPEDRLKCVSQALTPRHWQR